MMFKLRPYQIRAVEATLAHFRREKSPAVLVLPTGAGKSLVIAELARLARGRVLVLAHVRELVEQNYSKYISYGLPAGVFSAGLSRKESTQKVIFGSIQSIARTPAEFYDNFSLVVIDECHRVSLETETQYQQVLEELKKNNPEVCVLGLTATPYRLGLGWIYQEHAPKKLIRTDDVRFFKKCIFELPIRYLIDQEFLTRPVKIDAPVASYDFSSLKLDRGSFVISEIESLLKDQKRITPSIIKNIIELSVDRKGVMIFTSSVNHAVEIMQLLPPYVSALVTGETPSQEREEIIKAFKDQKLKFLVNVSVLTTGFDAPHVDVIAILRPTESVSLFQQIVGRGLRLYQDKKDCLILDYTGQGHDIYAPVIEAKKPSEKCVPVEVLCPQCGVENQFWGLRDGDGELIEHFGRKCQGVLEDPLNGETQACGYLFRFKRCECGEENDIAARACVACGQILIDPDKKLKEAMSLKDAHVMRVEMMTFQEGSDKRGKRRLEVHYYDADGEVLKEFFYLNSPEDASAFEVNFVRLHNRIPEKKFSVRTVPEAIGHHQKFMPPLYVIARKQKNYWAIREKIFWTSMK